MEIKGDLKTQGGGGGTHVTVTRRTAALSVSVCNHVTVTRRTAVLLVCGYDIWTQRMTKIAEKHTGCLNPNIPGFLTSESLTGGE